MFAYQISTASPSYTPEWADPHISASRSLLSRDANDLAAILNEFDCHQLADLDKANLMDRVDIPLSFKVIDQHDFYFNLVLRLLLPLKQKLKCSSLVLIIWCWYFYNY